MTARSLKKAKLELALHHLQSHVAGRRFQPWCGYCTGDLDAEALVRTTPARLRDTWGERR